MLRFELYSNGTSADEIPLQGAYAFGQDAIPMRAELVGSQGAIEIRKTTPGACGLALLWDAGQAGQYMLGTTRLPERDKPYNLNVELARAQMTHIIRKWEDWGLFDYAQAESMNKQFARVNGMFVESLKAVDPGAAGVLADQAVTEGVTLGEKIALFHADILLERRKSLAPPAGRVGFGCSVDLFATAADYTDRLTEAFDFVSIPVPWKHTEPKEHSYQYEQVDAWMNWASEAKKSVHAGPLLSFEPTQLPQWLYIWEHDFEALRDLIYERIEKVVRRYKNQVHVWNVVSGIHAYNSFNMNFEQLMELTRSACLLVKKLAPRSQVMVELVLPWGEYHARNQRTIPPLLYADMAVQSGIKLDAFGVQLCMGVPVDGMFVRDLMQISSLLDEFSGLGKVLHISACEVPSSTAADGADAWGGEAPTPKAGKWHAPWSQRLQAEWLQAFYRIGISKPFVESICWRDLADQPGHYLPHGGLCSPNRKPKLAYKELRNFKGHLLAAEAAARQARQDEQDEDEL